MTDSDKAPLYSALLKLKDKNQLSFHMPGHLGGKGMEGFDFLKEIDTTELPESDNLFFAEGVIAEAEAAAARFFGAKKTRFLVSGSSGGIMAAVGAALSEGDKIICDRFCHRSFVSALIFSGANPVWLRPEAIDGGLLWGGISPADVETAAKSNPDAKAVYITSPNYFGLCSDVAEIAEIAHNHGMLLIVDSAHGAHFGLSPLLPPSAVTLGADIVVTSAHKTLPSLTQSAYLHINREPPRLEAMLKMHQTSSPSYILMASLDYARAKMESEGEGLWTALAENVLEIFPEQAEIAGSAAKYKDVSRIVLPLASNPFSAAETLRGKGIAVECSYGGGLVCIANIAHTREDLLRLSAAVAEIDAEPYRPMRFAPFAAEAAMPPRKAFFSETEEIPIRKAAGRICAREVLVYPPGTPQLMPGEAISAEAAEAVAEITESGGEIHGVNGGKINVVKQSH